MTIIGADFNAYCIASTGWLSNVFYTYRHDRVSWTPGAPSCRFLVTTAGEWGIVPGGGYGGLLPVLSFFITQRVDLGAMCRWYAGPSEVPIVRGGAYYCTWSKSWAPAQRADGRLNY